MQGQCFSGIPLFDCLIMPRLLNLSRIIVCAPLCYPGMDIPNSNLSACCAACIANKSMPPKSVPPMSHVAAAICCPLTSHLCAAECGGFTIVAPENVCHMKTFGAFDSDPLGPRRTKTLATPLACESRTQTLTTFNVRRYGQPLPRGGRHLRRHPRPGQGHPTASTASTAAAADADQAGAGRRKEHPLHHQRRVAHLASTPQALYPGKKLCGYAQCHAQCQPRSGHAPIDRRLRSQGGRYPAPRQAGVRGRDVHTSAYPVLLLRAQPEQLHVSPQTAARIATACCHDRQLLTVLLVCCLFVAWTRSGRRPDATKVWK